MPLKRVLETLDGLSDAHKELYVERDGKWYLDAEGEDVDALKRARDHEKNAASEATRKLREAEAKLKEIDDAAEAARLEGLRGGGKLKEIEDAYKTQIEKLKKDAKEQLDRVTGTISSTMIGGASKALAAEISKVPALMQREIASRLSVDFDENYNPTLRILGADGKVSALTMDEFKKELVDNPDYSEIIIASRGSGGGASGNASPGSTGPKASDMTEAQRADLYRRDPVKFRQLFPPAHSE